MAETIEQYVARLSRLVGERDSLDLMAEAPGRLRTLVSGATPDELRWTSGSGRWTVTQIVAHMADAEIVGAWRFRTVLTQDGVPLQAYDQNAWAAAFRYEDAPPAESVGLFGALRSATLRLLRQADPARLRHAGMHAERGPESVEQLARMYAGHDLNHLAQIERLLNEARAAHS